ncbi:MAG TPA: sugar-binding domain-containing protein [Rectinemataceae bacterium]|nr:sugar-binding domain-containing protein [Rectinemataceae bacterium]
MHEYGLMIKVAELYYYKKLSQKAIAAALGISVPTVSRILSEALLSGLIKVEIVDVDQKASGLGIRLKEKFGVKDSVIVNPPASPNPEFLKKLLGKAAYEFVMNTVNPGTMVGLGPGSTMYEFVEAIDPMKQVPGITLVPLMGGWGYGGLAYEVNRLVSTAAAALHCQYHLMPCPALVSSEELHTMLMREPLIEEILRMWDSLDIAAFSLGGEVETGNYPQLRKNEVALPKAKAHGAVGDILGRFIDDAGRILDIEVNKRMVSIPLEKLAAIPLRIGIGGGNAKIRVLHAALKAGLINVLVSDATTCETILEMEDSTDERNIPCS